LPCQVPIGRDPFLLSLSFREFRFFLPGCVITVSCNVSHFALFHFQSDWDGNNEYEKQRATLLADLGYVGFAADIYGANLQENLTMDQRVEYTTLYRSNSTLFVQRMVRALEEVKMYDDVDMENIAVIGYCFGGTGVIQLAFSGNDEVKAVVSFHGGLTDLPAPETNVTPYTLM